MRILILSLAVFVLSTTHAQTGSEIFERAWQGKSVIISTISATGEIQVGHLMSDVDYDDDRNTFTATITSTIRIGSTPYRSTQALDGTVNTNTMGVTLKPGRLIHSDPLPNGMNWTSEITYMTLYRVPNENDEYIMEEQTSASSHPNETFWLTTDID